MHFHPSLVLALASLITIGSSSPVDHNHLANPTLLVRENPQCNCSGTKNNKTETNYVCGDYRLGPTKLPTNVPWLNIITHYDRFGGNPPGTFLKQWTYPNGSYRYPEHEGFQLNTAGEPIVANMTLKAGTKVDRFGDEGGQYFSTADAPYSQRALPPRNLDTNPKFPAYPNNYHLYEVIKDFVIEGGPIRPWFGQPGLGIQFYTGTHNISYLIEDQKLLKRIPLTDLKPVSNPCG